MPTVWTDPLHSAGCGGTTAGVFHGRRPVVIVADHRRSVPAWVIRRARRGAADGIPVGIMGALEIGFHPALCSDLYCGVVVEVIVSDTGRPLARCVHQCDMYGESYVRVGAVCSELQGQGSHSIAPLNGIGDAAVCA